MNTNNKKVSEDLRTPSIKYFEESNYAVAAYLASGATLVELDVLSEFNRAILLPLGIYIAKAFGMSDEEFKDMENKAKARTLDEYFKNLGRNN